MYIEQGGAENGLKRCEEQGQERQHSSYAHKYCQDSLPVCEAANCIDSAVSAKVPCLPIQQECRSQKKDSKARNYRARAPWVVYHTQVRSLHIQVVRCLNESVPLCKEGAVHAYGHRVRATMARYNGTTHIVGMTVAVMLYEESVQRKVERQRCWRVCAILVLGKIFVRRFALTEMNVTITFLKMSYDATAQDYRNAQVHNPKGKASASPVWSMCIVMTGHTDLVVRRHCIQDGKSRVWQCTPSL